MTTVIFALVGSVIILIATKMIFNKCKDRFGANKYIIKNFTNHCKRSEESAKFVLVASLALLIISALGYNFSKNIIIFIDIVMLIGFAIIGYHYFHVFTALVKQYSTSKISKGS